MCVYIYIYISSMYTYVYREPCVLPARHTTGTPITSASHGVLIFIINDTCIYIYIYAHVCVYISLSIYIYIYTSLLL